MIRTQVLKHLSRARSGKRGGSKRDVKGGANSNGAIEKSRYVRVVEGEEVRRDDPIKNFLPTRVRSTS